MKKTPLKYRVIGTLYVIYIEICLNLAHLAFKFERLLKKGIDILQRDKSL